MGVGRWGGKEDLGGVGGGQTVIKMYCMKTIYFQLKEKMWANTLSLFFPLKPDVMIHFLLEVPLGGCVWQFHVLHAASGALLAFPLEPALLFREALGLWISSQGLLQDTGPRRQASKVLPDGLISGGDKVTGDNKNFI